MANERSTEKKEILNNQKRTIHIIYSYSIEAKQTKQDENRAEEKKNSSRKWKNKRKNYDEKQQILGIIFLYMTKINSLKSNKLYTFQFYFEIDSNSLVLPRNIFRFSHFLRILFAFVSAFFQLIAT